MTNNESKVKFSGPNIDMNSFNCHFLHAIRIKSVSIMIQIKQGRCGSVWRWSLLTWKSKEVPHIVTAAPPFFFLELISVSADVEVCLRARRASLQQEPGARRFLVQMLSGASLQTPFFFFCSRINPHFRSRCCMNKNHLFYLWRRRSAASENMFCSLIRIIRKNDLN